MPHLPTTLVGLLSVVLAFIFYSASTDIPKTLSPQGCRMSWMSPSYILQTEFNTSWSLLAERYSLWLYREVGWEGTPVSYYYGSLLMCFELYVRVRCVGRRRPGTVHTGERGLVAPSPIDCVVCD